MSILIFAQLHSDKKQISVGFIGYPNVGKSSVINTLRSKKVCNVAPLAGETKVRPLKLFLFSSQGCFFFSSSSSIFIWISLFSYLKCMTHLHCVNLRKYICVFNYILNTLFFNMRAEHDAMFSVYGRGFLCFVVTCITCI